MTRILVDTSVWISHFKQSNTELVSLLAQDRVITHPMVTGEILCGTPPERNSLIAHFLNMPQCCSASLLQIHEFVGGHKIYGMGCGFIDISLLVSALITPDTQIWTQDKRLLKLAQRFSVAYTTLT